MHVGQSYSVLVTADQNEADYYIVTSPFLLNTSSPGGFDGVGELHYTNSLTPVNGPLPGGPDPFDLDSSVNQARSVRKIWKRLQFIKDLYTNIVNSTSNAIIFFGVKDL